MADGANRPTIHSKFSAGDADITIQSSDDVLFKLHCQNLATYTTAFPGTESSTQKKEVIRLTEPAKVLELAFQYVYPRKHPNLKDLDFDTLLQVAQAVEKYKIFSAMNTCEERLDDYLPAHAEEIFAHSMKHDYPMLVNKSAELLLETHYWNS